MKVIFKYELRLSLDGSRHFIPRNAEVLCIKEQRGVPTLWAKVDPNETVMDMIIFRPTGAEYPEEEERIEKYIDTILYHGGDLVFHLFIRS